jgi:hypothetical protein
MFAWIRTRVKNAVLLGVADALAHLAGADPADDGEALLAERCSLLPAPGLSEGEDPFAGTPQAVRNGRKSVKAG